MLKPGNNRELKVIRDLCFEVLRFPIFVWVVLLLCVLKGDRQSVFPKILAAVYIFYI